ncbi:MAG: hypothetical protein AAGC55_02535 [Myxococcota bacterium]
MGWTTDGTGSPAFIADGAVASPVGMAAWILEKFEAWTDGEQWGSISEDWLLDNLTLWWVTAKPPRADTSLQRSNRPSLCARFAHSQPLWRRASMPELTMRRPPFDFEGVGSQWSPTSRQYGRQDRRISPETT